MKFLSFFLLITFIQVSASTNGQNVSLQLKNVSVEEVFKSIEQQTGYGFLFTRSTIAGLPKVTISANRMLLTDFLNNFFKDKPLEYAVDNRTIIVKRQKKVADNNLEKNVDVSPTIITVQKTITGIVTDENGKPLAGVSVVIKGTNRGVSTDETGGFRIEVDKGQIIIVSFIGYQTKELQVDNVSNLKIMLVQVINPLDDIQIVAYGMSSKRLSTGNISSIKSEDILKSPLSNPISSLAGRMPGVMITESGGFAGSSPKVMIQGINSINAGNLPLYIIDGVPFGGKPVDQTAGSYIAPPSYMGQGFNPLNMISSNDIESISVLKDADATALYGSRAANGVIVITTKKGHIGKARIDINLSTGINKQTREIEMLNTKQFLDMRKEAFNNDGLSPTLSTAQDLLVFDQNLNRNFQKELLGRTGHFSNADLSISGGTQQVQYVFSGNYRTETPVVPGDFKDERVQLRTSTQYNSINRKFRSSLAISYSKDNNSVPASFYNQFIMTLPPNLPTHKADGSLDWYTGYTNPFAYTKRINSVKTDNIFVNGSIGYYDIMPGLTIKTDLGYNRISAQTRTINFIASNDPSVGPTGSSILNLTTNETYLIEPQLLYNKNVGKGKLDLVLGGTYQYSTFEQPIFFFGRFTNDLFAKSMGNQDVLIKSSGFKENKYASMFGRLGYNLMQKYLVNFSFRRDGSSRFSPNSRFGQFGSVGAGWIFSNEKFLKDNLSVLSFGKIKSSYGTIGNDQISDYGFLQLYSSTTYTYNGKTGLAPRNLGNPNNYTWEITRKFDVGIDLGFLENKITTSFLYYNNVTNNMISNNVPVASQSGFTGYIGNLKGLKVENKGIEIEVMSSFNLNKSIQWRSNLNFTIPQNKLLSYPDLLNTSLANTSYVIGQPLNILYGYKFSGFKDNMVTVQDLDKDGVITAGLFANGKGDFEILGSSFPKFYGGFNNSFSYNSFTLDFLIQYTKQDGYNLFRSLKSYPGGPQNFPTDIMEYPFKYSSIAGSPASKSFTNLFLLSDQTVSDASYLRLKNVSFSWSLPKRLLENIKCSSASLYVRGQNLLTITNYKGIDPETKGIDLPPFKMIVFGIQTSF